MKILLVGEFSFGSLGSSYSTGFKKLGQEIIKFDFVQESKMLNPFSVNKYLNKLFGHLYNYQINQRLLEKIKTIKPELILVLKGTSIYPEILMKIKENPKTILFCFNPDNPFNLFVGASNDLIRKSIPLYDCYFIWGKFLIPKLIEAGAKKVEYLPFAYDTELHYPVDLSNEDKTVYGSDIAFIGSYDKEREEFLMNLIGYDLAIWGNGWNRLSLFSPLRKNWKSRDAIGKDFSKICNASKIILNHIRKQNGNAHNMKTFEIPACKGFMLTTRTKEQCEFFEEGKDIACFETQEELKDKIKQSLNDSKVRQSMSENAYKKIQGHSYDVRVKEILDIYSKIK